MTRTRITEAELVELQRKALSCFQNLDNLANWAFNHLSEAQAEKVDLAAQLAREVSDEVDQLTDFVRTEFDFTREVER